VAAAKGLVAGYLAIVKNDKSVIDCRIGNEVWSSSMSKYTSDLAYCRVFWYQVSTKLTVLTCEELGGRL
jgi:hypothetical protein